MNVKVVLKITYCNQKVEIVKSLRKAKAEKNIDDKKEDWATKTKTYHSGTQPLIRGKSRSDKWRSGKRRSAKKYCAWHHVLLPNGHSPNGVIPTSALFRPQHYSDHSIAIFSRFFQGCSRVTGPEKLSIVMVLPIREVCLVLSIQNKLGNADHQHTITGKWHGSHFKIIFISMLRL